MSGGYDGLARAATSGAAIPDPACVFSRLLPRVPSSGSTPVDKLTGSGHLATTVFGCASDRQLVARASGSPGTILQHAESRVCALTLAWQIATPDGTIRPFAACRARR